MSGGVFCGFGNKSVRVGFIFAECIGIFFFLFFPFKDNISTIFTPTSFSSLFLTRLSGVAEISPFLFLRCYAFTTLFFTILCVSLVSLKAS